jgi:hypothetical protein
MWAIVITLRLGSVTYFNLLRKHWANWNKTWLECSLNGPIKKLMICFFQSEIHNRNKETQMCQKGWLLYLHVEHSFLNQIWWFFSLMFLIKFSLWSIYKFCVALTIKGSQNGTNIYFKVWFVCSFYMTQESIRVQKWIICVFICIRRAYFSFWWFFSHEFLRKIPVRKLLSNYCRF